MPVYTLTEALRFPPPSGASADGLVAIGGDASPDRLALAYREGIFPWPRPGLPLLWFSPDPRFVLSPSDVHISRTLRRELKRDRYEIRMDTRFSAVMRACAEAPRPGQAGTWITDELLAGYTSLHRRGLAHSVEVFDQETLVGGLYGVSLGHAFFGESMFSRVPNASKIAFAYLLGHLFGPWEFHFVDCQVYTAHLEAFGARELSRADFLDDLEHTLASATRRGPWAPSLSARELLSLLADS